MVATLTVSSGAARFRKPGAYIRIEEIGALRVLRGGTSDLRAERPPRFFGPDSIVDGFGARRDEAWGATLVLCSRHLCWRTDLRLHGSRRARSPFITGNPRLAAAAACPEVAVIPLMLTKNGERANAQNESWTRNTMPYREFAF
jgi:hypothetical protein